MTERLAVECKAILGYLIELIRECTGLIFVRGWSGQRINTVILKAYCKQDKHYQVLKPREEVKKHHDPDNLKQFLCGSSLSLHCNFKNQTIKVCFFHSIKHEVLPISETPRCLEEFITKNVCFTSRECFDCVKRAPEFAEFANSYDSKKIVRKIWKANSQSLWSLDPNPIVSALRLLEKFELAGEIEVLNPKEVSLEIQENIRKAKAIGFLYKEIIKEIKTEVTEVVIDSTYSLSDDFKQYFVVVASYHGKGVPIGTMMTQTNSIDHFTIKWFLEEALKDFQKVACVNTDWALAEIKAIKELKYSNQICLFHTLNSIRCKRYATVENLRQIHLKNSFQKFLEYEWVDATIFYAKLNDTIKEEKINEGHIRNVVKITRLAVCDHLVYHQVYEESCSKTSESTEFKFKKIYEMHLKDLYRYVVKEQGLIFYFAYLFDQYYNQDSFRIMSRLGKPKFFSTLRTSMMCESYFNQLKSWTLSHSRPPRVDTLIYIIINREIPKIKDIIKQMQRFERCTNENILVQTHRRMLPTWRKQWILEWKNLAIQQKKLDYNKILQEIEVNRTKLNNWLCPCSQAKLSPTSSCIHLFTLFQQRYPNYHGYHLQRFAKRKNWIPLIEHSSIVNCEENIPNNFKQPIFQEIYNNEDGLDSNYCEDGILSENEGYSYESECIQNEQNEQNIAINNKDEKKIEIFQFFLSQMDTRELILQTPHFTKMLDEMTYIINRTQYDKAWRPRTNTPENGLEYQAWIRSLKYYQQYLEFKQIDSLRLPM